jgi:prepilin-type N-terminal cleavage/methylation domain-containing protein
MKIIGHPSRRRLPAFTLIELIVVIAVIAILASLIFPIIGVLKKKRNIAVAQTQLKAIEMAIDGYKTKLGFYPPDNTNNVVTNQLYFELMGTTNNGSGATGPTAFGTLDGSGYVTTTELVNFIGASLPNAPTGLANTSTRMHSDDQGAAATSFIDHLTPNQIGVIDPAGHPQVKILVCTVEWPADKQPPVVAGTQLNPWRYNSSHPTNNTATYDLWVDVVIGSKTNRVCNWSTQPIQL